MWYIKHSKDMQSVMLEEGTGKTVAVFYDEADARKMEALLYETKDSNIFEEKDDDQLDYN